MKVKGPNGAELRKEGASWIDRIKAASKIEQDWLDAAEYATSAYTNETDTKSTSSDSCDGYDYNMAFANVETIVPAIINSAPIPDIRRRFGDNDEPARVISDVLERVIRIQTDDNKLQIELEAAAQDAFLAGRGLVRLRFYSDIVGGEISKDDIEDISEGETDDEENGTGIERRTDILSDVRDDAAAVRGEAGRISGVADYREDRQDSQSVLAERVENERLKPEAVSWRDFRHGPAKRWDEIPWAAFRFCVPREDEDKEFTPGLISSQLTEDDKNKRSGSGSDLTGWEIWCKKSRKVYFVDDDGVMLKQVEDPLGLTYGLAGWFPICTPMQPIEVNGRLRPVNPFSIYRKLADEMDDITKRIKRIVNAMKVKGWYAGSQKEFENIQTLDDDEFIGIADPELWASNGGMEKAMAFWPVERFIVVLKELYAAREQTKQAIYEITGISDIVRGASKASETLGAQEIKSQWGSLRIQKMQRMIERAARDIFVMMAELIASKFTPETLQEMSGIALLPTPQDDPQAMQQKQQVLQLLTAKAVKKYRIDVESDSTVRADLTRQKQEVAEFLQGAASYFQAVAPLVQEGALPADAAVDIFASTARMFNLGKSVEDTLEKMVVDAKAKAQQAKDNPQAEKPDPEMVKAQTEQQKLAAQAQIAGAKAQSDQAAAQAQMETIRAKLEGDMAKIQADVQAKQIESQIRMSEASAKRETEREAHSLAMQKGELELAKIMAEIEKIRASTSATVEGAKAKQAATMEAAE